MKATFVWQERYADIAPDATAGGFFLVLPHPRHGESALRKANDCGRWLEGTNRGARELRDED
jgi:hypothetical protein